MILATGCEPIAPPKRDGLSMFDIEVDTPRFDGADELKPDEWIYAHTAALPHVDDQRHFGCRFFLTLSCVSGWIFGDARDSHRNWSPGRPVQAGTLFVVDLGSVHWLFTANMGVLSFPRPDLWAGLQWRCKDLRALKRRARDVVAKLGGTWEESDDARYRRIKP